MLSIVTTGLALSEPALSRDRDRNDFGSADVRGQEAGLVERRTSRMTAAQAARQAQQRYGGGKVLSVDSTGDGFHVKLLRNGDVRVVFIPNR